MTNILDQVATLWTQHRAAVVLAAVAVIVLMLIALRVVSRARNASRDVKLTIGTVVVQAGVTWAVATGTYVACTRILHVERLEAVAFAVFFEAATWVSIGMIRAHGKGTDETGQPNEGFGAAGPFFWVFTTCGGLLAVIGADTTGAKVGRTLIVVIGACLWYLQLLRWTRRSGKPGQFLWTPRRLLVAVGAFEPGDHDVRDENREWKIRRLARAMRWANSRWSVLGWLGKRSLIRHGESVKEDVIKEARRRFAVTHLLASTCDPESDVMRRIIADVKTEHAGETVADWVQERPAIAGASRVPVPVQPERDAQDGGQDVPVRESAPSGQDAPVRVPATVPTSPVPSPRGRTAVRTDDELRVALASVARDPDGTVPPRRAATALGCGYDRAKRLVEEAGLLPGGTGVNGHAVPGLVAVGSAQE